MSRMITMSKDADMLNALEQYILDVVGQRTDVVKNNLTGYYEIWLRSDSDFNHRASVNASVKFVRKWYEVSNENSMG